MVKYPVNPVDPVKTNSREACAQGFHIDCKYQYMVLRVMRIAEDRLKRLCKAKGITIKKLLDDSGVSKNAFYSLARKNSILPRSITAIADSLNVCPSEFLDEPASALQRRQELYAKSQAIAEQYDDVDPDNIVHTLLLLDEKPIERLRRALTRAQRFDFR